MTAPSKRPRRTIHVRLDQELIDAVDVECEILMVSRNFAVAKGLEMWLEHVRRHQAFPRALP